MSAAAKTGGFASISLGNFIRRHRRTLGIQIQQNRNPASHGDSLTMLYTQQPGAACNDGNLALKTEQLFHPAFIATQKTLRVWPPSETIVAPVMNEERFEHRNTARSAISSGVPNR